MMERLTLLLLWLTAALVMNLMGNTAEAEEAEPLLRNFTNQFLKVIPPNDNSSVTKLVMEGNQISLNETDRLALASYPSLLELNLERNLISAVPASYFSGLPHLRVLSLARNNISSLDPEAFSGLDVLTELDLSFNLLTSLPAQLIRGLKDLQMLNLQGNPWNCSCPLLSTIGEITTANLTIGGPGVVCASPAEWAGSGLLEVTALCSASPLPTSTTTQQLPTSAHSILPAILKTTPPSGQNHSTSKGQTPALGNSWKFTVCVAALAVTTSILIICAIKGPSWYKLFDNYRHRRLHPEDEGEDGIVSTMFSDVGRDPSHQTFTFEQQNGQIGKEEEEEDGYFEDPYFRRDE